MRSKDKQAGLKLYCNLHYNTPYTKTPLNVHELSVVIWYYIVLKKLENIFFSMESIIIIINAIGMETLLQVDH